MIEAELSPKWQFYRAWLQAHPIERRTRKEYWESRALEAEGLEEVASREVGRTVALESLSRRLSELSLDLVTADQPGGIKSRQGPFWRYMYSEARQARADLTYAKQIRFFQTMRELDRLIQLAELLQANAASRLEQLHLTVPGERATLDSPMFSAEACQECKKASTERTPRKTDKGIRELILSRKRFRILEGLATARESGPTEEIRRVAGLCADDLLTSYRTLAG